MQFGGKVPPAWTPGTMGGRGIKSGLTRGDNVEFDEDMSGRLSRPRGGMARGYSKGGKVSGGYAVHGESDKYKVGE